MTSSAFRSMLAPYSTMTGWWGGSIWLKSRNLFLVGDSPVNTNMKTHSLTTLPLGSDPCNACSLGQLFPSAGGRPVLLHFDSFSHNTLGFRLSNDQHLPCNLVCTDNLIDPAFPAPLVGAFFSLLCILLASLPGSL